MPRQKDNPDMSTSDTKGINLNTVLLTVLLALSGWTLKTVYEMSNQVAVITNRVDQHDKVLTGHDSRLGDAEREIVNLRVRQAGVRPAAAAITGP